jgi:serine/threonine protein kinase
MLPMGLHAGVTLGRYQLVRLVGEGASGSVFEANDAVLSRRVAVKVLRIPSLGGEFAERAQSRFLREGRIASRVRHAHVVAVHDFGVHEGVPFLVMEFVEGESLAQLLWREGPLPLARAVGILLPILSAVAELHASRVVHRDIKPGNVLLPRGDEARPKLADFGVSRFIEESGELTRSGTLIGTVEYMAPELARDGRAAAERSDQYALGVVLYESATGHKPFSGSTDYAVIYAAVSKEVLAPSHHEPSLPRAFDDIVLRAMHRDPEQRYGSVDELAQALLPLASEAGRARWHSEFVIPVTQPASLDEHRAGCLVSRSPSGVRTRCDTAVETARRPSSSSHPPGAPDLPASRPPSRPPPVSRGVLPSVLVVDDDDLNLQTFRRAFRSDFEITCTDSGARALELLADASFDVALVDYAMPGMNGVEFLRAARALRADFAAIMVTAHADLAEVRDALTRGWVHAVIMKPYDREGILRWVLHCHRMSSMRKTVGSMMARVKEG